MLESRLCKIQYDVYDVSYISHSIKRAGSRLTLSAASACVARAHKWLARTGLFFVSQPFFQGKVK